MFTIQLNNREFLRFIVLKVLDKFKEITIEEDRLNCKLRKGVFYGNMIPISKKGLLW